MGMRQAILVIALVAALLPSVSDAQALSAEAMIAACQSRARLTDQWNPLQAERDQLAQTLRNFGFDNTVAQQEALGQRADEILRDNGVNARKDFMDKTASEAATAMNGFLENLETHGRALNRAELGQLEQMARRLPQRAREAIMKIAQAPRIPIPGSPVWRAAFDAVGHASTLHKLATTESAARQGWEAFMAAAGVVSPPLGLVVSNLDYAANNLWGLGQLAWTAQQIRTLTNATEADLKLLKTTTDRMNVVGRELGKIRAGLNALPPCDSTQLTRGDLGPQAPASGGGLSGGAIAGIIAGGAAVPVGIWAYEEYKKTLADTGTGGTSGGSTGGGSTGGGSSIATSITAAGITCTQSQGGSGLYQCSGTMTVRIGPSVTSGVGLTALTLPVQIVGRATPTRTGAGETVTFTFSNSTASGCQNFTRVNFVRQPDVNTAFTTWTGTIPVTCR